MPNSYGMNERIRCVIDTRKGEAMTIREYLEQYKESDQKAKRIRKEYEKEKIMIDAISSPLGTDGTPHGSGISRTVEMRAVKLADKMAEYKIAELDAFEIRQHIFDAIMVLDGIEYDVLYEKYIEYFNSKTNKLKTWDDVADAVHVSERAVYNIRRRAFRKLKMCIVLQNYMCNNDIVNR